MRTNRFRVALLFMPLFTASLAYGQTQRTFVSTHSGSDTNPCSVAQPCRNFSAAMAQTLAGGEIIVLDSGGYGPVTIDKSVSIVSPAGVYAGVTAFSGNAILINAADLTIVLEGLTLNGLGGARGISQPNSGALFVKRNLITGFSDAGISLNTGGEAQLLVADSDIRNNGTNGIFLFINTNNRLRLTLDHVRVNKNLSGVTLATDRQPYSDVNVRLNAYECVFAGNQGSGVSAGRLTAANLESCLISHNTYGVSVIFGNGVAVNYGTVRISNCTITNNTTKGINDPSGNGAILSRQNNTVEGNAADDAPGMYTAK